MIERLTSGVNHAFLDPIGADVYSVGMILLIQQPVWKKYSGPVCLAAAWIFLGFLIAMLFFGKTGLRATRDLELRIHAIEQDIVHLQAENDALRDELQYRTTELYLEELARTELGRIFPGERLFVFPTPTAGGTPIP